MIRHAISRYEILIKLGEGELVCRRISLMEV